MAARSSLPNEPFKAQIYAEFPEIDSNAFAGVSLVHSFNDFSGLLVADFIAVTLSLSGTAFYCAVRIHLTLKRTVLSSNAKRLLRQMFRVLLVQTACPTLFLIFPASAAHIILFGGMETDQSFTDGLGVIVSLYPLFNPLVTMFSISGYRRYLFSLFNISNES
ncbi:unnamed protein product [Heligmosomoides polygyrus]|uniref:G protein-coupled receptor n=1 Tax=Heligmosomoides polygyrus TaxID=6339 RepID=A0A183FY46_HELPZ|nr:unnamed protein product [Heligmosomoides polygyrus]